MSYFCQAKYQRRSTRRGKRIKKMNLNHSQMRVINKQLSTNIQIKWRQVQNKKKGKKSPRIRFNIKWIRIDYGLLIRCFQKLSKLIQFKILIGHFRRIFGTQKFRNLKIKMSKSGISKLFILIRGGRSARLVSVSLIVLSNLTTVQMKKCKVKMYLIRGLQLSSFVSWKFLQML